ncbi:hypothetical protein BDV98DRAFT_584262 [Pterulicium gracile]|uniref:MYND-type domain-containing protein n=1 Tax=Pterulicium gracile TaxID=1884261 RepID=A0A5C3QB16_9AGAR|nr:hypothetical protein BDV98DRAFT_584262 [Pterula gracilis]
MCFLWFISTRSFGPLAFLSVCTQKYQARFLPVIRRREHILGCLVPEIISIADPIQARLARLTQQDGAELGLQKQWEWGRQLLKNVQVPGTLPGRCANPRYVSIASAGTAFPKWANCQIVPYCSHECQNQAWFAPSHRRKFVCQALAVLTNTVFAPYLSLNPSTLDDESLYMEARKVCDPEILYELTLNASAWQMARMESRGSQLQAARRL